MSTIGYWGSTPTLEDDAKGILSLVWNCYPGHDWEVKCYPGVIFIRDLSFGPNWGMNIRVSEFDYDAAVLKKKILMLTGEWLERAGKARGRKDGDQEIERVDGVPEKWQPNPNPSKLTQVQFDAVIAAAEREMRDDPRPQAVELAKK